MALWKKQVNSWDRMLQSRKCRKIMLGPDATVPPVKGDTAAAVIKKRGPIGQ